LTSCRPNGQINDAILAVEVANEGDGHAEALPYPADAPVAESGYDRGWLARHAKPAPEILRRSACGVPLYPRTHITMGTAKAPIGRSGVVTRYSPAMNGSGHPLDHQSNSACRRELCTASALSAGQKKKKLNNDIMNLIVSPDHRCSFIHRHRPVWARALGTAGQWQAKIW